MNNNKKEYRPEIILEEIDFKKLPEENIAPLINKRAKFLKDLLKDISFISIVSITLFSVLGNFSIYMFQKNPPSITYIPKQVNLSETELITKTAYETSKELLNFNLEKLNNSSLKKYFYADNFEQWKATLKQIGIYDKVVNNKGIIATDITEVNLVSKVIVHGMVRNIISIPFTQTYTDINEKTVTEGQIVLTMIENPEKNNEFLISNTKLLLGDRISITEK